MRTLLACLALVGLALGGCKKDYPQCTTYVDLAMKCDSDLKSAPSDEKNTAKLMLGGMCEEAFKDDTSRVSGDTRKMVSEMYSELRTRANCVAEANTCEQYTKCTN